MREIHGVWLSGVPGQRDKEHGPPGLTAAVNQGAHGTPEYEAGDPQTPGGTSLMCPRLTLKTSVCGKWLAHLLCLHPPCTCTHTHTHIHIKAHIRFHLYLHTDAHRIYL